MSDFDKEAEREKLREKYGRDEDDREATERMSDLLLKGATMTNAHCGTCGDPIFRYEGQEFCPTCQEVVSEAADEQGDADQPADTDQPADAATPDEPATASDAQPSQHAGNGRVDAGGTATPDASTDTSPADWTTSIDPSVADAVETGDQSANTSQATAPSPTPSAGESAGSLAGARDSLNRTIVRLTRQAEASDDLERTRAYLAAVEEAADALAAVKRADR